MYLACILYYIILDSSAVEYRSFEAIKGMCGDVVLYIFVVAQMNADETKRTQQRSPLIKLSKDRRVQVRVVYVVYISF